MRFFLTEIIFILNVINNHIKDHYDMKNLILVVISYGIYEMSLQRLVS